MLDRTQTRISKMRMISIGVLVLALIALIAVIVIMAADVRARLTELSAADADSVPWQMSQLEVEFLSFKLELREGLNEPVPDLTSMRDKFDIFYSRIEVFNTSPNYVIIRENPEFSGTLRALTDYRDRLAALFDAGLVTAETLPELLEETVPARANIREMALFGVGLYARQSDIQRQALAGVLSRLAILLGALVACLMGAIVVVAGLVLRAMSRSREILRTSARLKAVSDTSLEAILTTDASGKVLDFNRAAEEIFHVKAEQIIGQSFMGFIVPEAARDGPEAGYWHYHRSDEAKLIELGRQEVDAQRASGEIFPIELAVSRTDTPDGEIFLHFMRDISDRRATEQELREARDEALAGEQAKASLLAVMSHEMRTPLNGILGTLELLNRTELTSAQRDHMEVMAKSGDLLLNHVNDVLELSRLDSGQAEMDEDVFSLLEILEDVTSGLHHLADAAGTKFEIVRDGEDLDHVRGAPRRLRQVLVNLVGNAVKFTENGRITLAAQRAAGDDIVELRVSDTGIGIAEEDQARIFDEFVTIDPNYNRKAEGTGLGLAITRRLVEAMGGAISVCSKPGEGTTFTVTLPLPSVPSGRRALDAKDSAPNEAPQFPGMNVLLVEDNAINRRIAGAMLDGLKCNVVEAEDGAKGVQAASEKKFDVILMDISMPEMDGIEATRRIRAGPSASKETNIIALTAHAMQEDVERFQAAGMNDVVVKPISADRLATAIDRRRAPRRIWSEDKSGSTWDADVFGEFLQVLGAADTSEMMMRFLDDARDVVPWLVWQSSEETDHEQVAKKAHGLAGSAAVLGATELHAALRALEEAARKDRPIAGKGADLDRIWAATERDAPMIENGSASVA